jgi:vancomycin resistance protein VanJ
MAWWISIVMLALIGVVLAVLASSSGASPLHLMTYNVQYNNPDPRATIDAIADADADVVLLQEVTTTWREALDRRFKDIYPHRAYRIPGVAGEAVLSKRPISVDEVLRSPNDARFVAQRVVIDGIQILNVHLRPAIDRGSWIRGFFTTPAMRLREARAYWPQLVHGTPTVVAGDFNEDIDGKAIAFLAGQGLSLAGAPGPKTWHQKPLAIDLDHVMIDATLEAKDGAVLDAGTSDHRPVVVTIERK